MPLLWSSISQHLSLLLSAAPVLSFTKCSLQGCCEEGRQNVQSLLCVRPNVLWGNMNTEKKLPSSLLFSFFFLAFSFSFSFSFFSLPPFHLAPSLSFLLYTHMLTTFVMGQKKKNACLIIIFWCAKPYFCSEIKDSWAEQRMLCFS